MARLVVRDVENDRQASAAASEKLDERLRAAELVTKARKGKKPKAVTKAAKRARAGSEGVQASVADLWAYSDDPVKVAALESFLAARRG
jgi:hypothetical protein